MSKQKLKIRIEDHAGVRMSYPDSGMTTNVRVSLGGDYVDLTDEGMTASARGDEPCELTDFFGHNEIEAPGDNDPFWPELSEMCEKVMENRSELNR